MTVRLSIEEARSLGILPGGPAPEPRKPTAAQVALAEATKPRRSAKGGRHARAADGEPELDAVSFVVAHAPKTKQRARTQMSKQAIKNAFLQARGNFGTFCELVDRIPHRSFTPKDTETFEKQVSSDARAAMGQRPPFAGPVEMELTFIFEGDEARWPTDVTDADLDNAEKAVLDGLNGIAFVDDRLVVRKRGQKICGPVPGVMVTVRALAR